MRSIPLAKSACILEHNSRDAYARSRQDQLTKSQLLKGALNEVYSHIQDSVQSASGFSVNVLFDEAPSRFRRKQQPGLLQRLEALLHGQEEEEPPVRDTEQPRQPEKSAR